MVIEEALQQPILGFNVINVLLNKSNNTNALINSLTKRLVNTSCSNVSTLVNLISETSEDENIIVITMPNTANASTGKLVNVPCKLNLSSASKTIRMLFRTEEIEFLEGLETVNTIVTVTPGRNDWVKTRVLDNSKHVILQKNTTVGRKNPANFNHNTVTSHAVLSAATNEVKSDRSAEVASDIKIKEHQRKVMDQIDLSGLNPKQRQMVEQMLIQVAAALSVEDSDIANVTFTSMYIKLHDNTSVQVNYHSVPKSLYAEMKENIYEWVRVPFGFMNTPS